MLYIKHPPPNPSELDREHLWNSHLLALRAFIHWEFINWASLSLCLPFAPVFENLLASQVRQYWSIYLTDSPTNRSKAIKTIDSKTLQDDNAPDRLRRPAISLPSLPETHPSLIRPINYVLGRRLRLKLNKSRLAEVKMWSLNKLLSFADPSAGGEFIGCCQCRHQRWMMWDNFHQISLCLLNLANT